MPPKRSSDGAKKSPAAKSPVKSSANGDAAEAAEELLQNVPSKKKPKKAGSKLSKGIGKRVMTKKGDIFHSISAKQQETVLTLSRVQYYPVYFGVSNEQNFYVSQYINAISSAYGTYRCFQTFWNFLSESYHFWWIIY